MKSLWYNDHFCHTNPSLINIANELVLDYSLVTPDWYGWGLKVRGQELHSLGKVYSQ